MKDVAYRIYTEYNCADTCRDPDDIHTTEIGYKHTLKDALLFAKNYIKENFSNKDIELHKNKNNHEATDFCSYGKTIHVKEMMID